MLVLEIESDILYGSDTTCIAKFIPLYENGIEVIGEEAKVDLLRRRQAVRKASSREARGFAALAMLATSEPNGFNKPSWKSRWKVGYSARQLVMISTVCKEHKIPFNPADFPINTCRGNIIAQVKELEPWQYRRLRSALPKSWLIEFDAIFSSQLYNTRK